MKRFLILFIAAIFCFTAATPAVAGEGYGWYCMRKKDHERPTCEPEMAFISEHSGYYIGSDPDEKVIYLTFDAGYENGNVARIVDTLDRHGAKGAFFVLENFIEKNPELIKKMSDGGHFICNHTCRHRDMTKLGDDEFEAELTALEDVAAANGIELKKYYRPPEGRFSRENLEKAEEMGYKTIFWSVAYADWDNSKQPPADKATRLLIDNTHNGAVILLHPTSKTNADILDALLSAWEKDGYRFGTLDELTEAK
ncbi:MAG: polysaccharide deacetylase family protein [Clostridia bacterium]|nr:polysaccharide deacetylase family protein [Clostridia bacterium]